MDPVRFFRKVEGWGSNQPRTQALFSSIKMSSVNPVSYMQISYRLSAQGGGGEEQASTIPAKRTLAKMANLNMSQDRASLPDMNQFVSDKLTRCNGDNFNSV